MTEIKYISAKDAIATFHYLYEYSSELYSRDSTELTVEEYITYQMALTVPKFDGGQWIRIDEPLMIFENNGKLYLASGNSRMQTIERMIKGGSKEEFADIRYVILDRWNNEELLRLQYSTNDLTRKNSRLRKLRQIASYINKLIAATVKPADAKKSAQLRFGVSATDIKNAFLLTDNVPSTIEKFLNDGLIKTDPAIELINIQKALNVSPETVVADLIKDNLPLSLPNIKKWRSQYVQTSDSKPATVEKYLDNSEVKKAETTLVEGTEEDNNLPKPPKPDKATTQDKSEVLVPLGNIELNTVMDAKKVAYVLANLIDNNRLNDKTEQVKDALIQLFSTLHDLELPEDIRNAIAESFND